MYTIKYHDLGKCIIIAKSDLEAQINYIYLNWDIIMNGRIAVFNYIKILRTYYKSTYEYHDYDSIQMLSDYKKYIYYHYLQFNLHMEYDNIKRRTNYNIGKNFMDDFRKDNLKFIIMCIKTEMVGIPMYKPEINYYNNPITIKRILKTVKNTLYWNILRLLQFV